MEVSNMVNLSRLQRFRWRTDSTFGGVKCKTIETAVSTTSIWMGSPGFDPTKSLGGLAWPVLVLSPL